MKDPLHKILEDIPGMTPHILNRAAFKDLDRQLWAAALRLAWEEDPRGRFSLMTHEPRACQLYRALLEPYDPHEPDGCAWCVARTRPASPEFPYDHHRPDGCAFCKETIQ
jgi:hypothetical protein